jgi:cell division septation protein DedD
MNRSVVSRSQRRLEKKQAVLLLALVLAAALASFALGVMVGRAGSRAAPEPPPAAAPVRLPVAPPGPEGATGSSGAQKGGDLTFYDSLPSGAQAPLGSGINLPPKGEAKVSIPVSPPPPDPATPPPAQAAVAANAETSPPTAAATKPAPPVKTAAAKSDPPKKTEAPAKSAAPPAPPAAAGGAFVVQAAAFREAADAGSLRERLAGKGYAAYTQEANLGEKGVWHRVYVGPFATTEAAQAAAARLQADEKLSAMVRRR